MANQHQNVDPSATPVTEPDRFSALQQRIGDALAAEGKAVQDLSAVQVQGIVRLAELDILGSLEADGVREAGSLARSLEDAAKGDENADLVLTVASRLDTAQGRREEGSGAHTQSLQYRKALLATATGETAVAVVASVLNPDSVPRLVNSGRESVQDFRRIRKSRAVPLLHDLLNRAEASAALSEEVQDGQPASKA
ncbi:MAG TPA: hypothetical protein VN554_00625 [Verrucomicrobiae bacterium]|nr:hypothetical protein [Verrucomicrobiae bacterium]